jgi:hypothetical protein
MSHRNKKLSASKYKGRGLLLYQNLWHKSKLTHAEPAQTVAASTAAAAAAAAAVAAAAAAAAHLDECPVQ